MQSRRHHIPVRTSIITPCISATCIMSGLSHEVVSRKTFHDFQQCNSNAWTLSLLASQKHQDETSLLCLTLVLVGYKHPAFCLLMCDFWRLPLCSSAHAAFIHHWDTASTGGHDPSFPTSARLPDIQLIREEDMSAVCGAAQNWNMLSWPAAWVLHLCPSSPG